MSGVSPDVGAAVDHIVVVVYAVAAALVDGGRSGVEHIRYGLITYGDGRSLSGLHLSLRDNVHRTNYSGVFRCY